jgi:phage gpG-like protein
MTVSADITQVNTALNALSSQLGNMQPVYEDIGNYLKNVIQANLGRGITPWSDPFIPLKKPRKHDKGLLPGIPLNDTRQHIYNKINFKADSSSVEVGILEDSLIGAVHQFGATIDHPAHQRTLHFKVNSKTGQSKFASKRKSNFSQDVHIAEHTITIPARPFMPIKNDEIDLPDVWAREILSMIRAHFD